MTPDLRCPECRFHGNQLFWIQNGKRCPNCGSTVVPYDPDQDLLLVAQATDINGGTWIRVGWAELRVLSIWARFWADQKTQEDPEKNHWMLRVVDAITFNLKKAGSGKPLTIGDDLELQRLANPNAKVVRPDGTEVVLEPGWLNRMPVEDPPSDHKEQK